MFSKMRAASIFLAGLLAASVFAGGGKDAASGASGEGADGKIRLAVLNYADLTAPNATADQAWVFGEFLKNNPDIEIVREDLNNEPFHNKTEAYAASGNLPDVLYVWPSGRSSTLHANRLIKDLGPLVAKDNIKDRYLPLTMDPKQQFGGYLAEIPIGITSTHAFYINTDVLNACGLQPAKTYAELKAQVPILKAKGYETIIMPLMDSWVMQSCLFSLVAGRFGGVDWEKKILSGQTKFTDPDFVNALTFISTMYKDGVLATSSIGTSYGEGPGLFATNKCAYYIDGDWRVSAFITDTSTGQALISPEKQRNIRITVFPDIEGAKVNKSTSSVLGVGWAMSAAIPSGSAKEDAAWRLIKWLTGPEVLGLNMSHGGLATPSRVDIDSSAMALEPMQVGIANLGKEYNTATCVIDGAFHIDVHTPINDGLVELGLGSKTPAQLAADIQRAFDSAKAAGKF